MAMEKKSSAIVKIQGLFTWRDRGSQDLNLALVRS